MIFLELSKSQLSRGEMRNVTGGNQKLTHAGEGGGDSCHAHCTSGVCDNTDCKCIEAHGARRCYLK